MNIGENIKNYRKVRGLTQKELADLSNYSESAIRKIENNDRMPNSRALISISKAFGVSEQELINGENLVPVRDEPVTNEIIVFSHISGKVETITCEEYEIVSIGNTAYVKAINSGEVKHIIPFNRVKQINLNIRKNESEDK